MPHSGHEQRLLVEPHRPRKPRGRPHVAQQIHGRRRPPHARLARESDHRALECDGGAVQKEELEGVPEVARAVPYREVGDAVQDRGGEECAVDLRL